MEDNFLDAARFGDLDEVRRLVNEEGVNPNYQDLDCDGETALHCACDGYHFDIVRYLVEEAQVDVHAIDKRGFTALHCAHFSPRFGNVDEAEGTIRFQQLVSYLVETAGISIDTQVNNGQTLLSIVAGSFFVESADIIRYLVENLNADLDLEDEYGKTPLCYALAMGVVDNAVYILSTMESVDENALSAVWNKNNNPWHVKKSVLEKYASGQGQSEQLATNPLHTLMHFPLPNTRAFQDCIENFSLSSLSILDNHGRLPIHVLLSSPNETLNTPSMVHFLYHPRSAVTRDPTTSLYPYEAEALLTAANDRRRSSFGSETLLNTVYELFRAEPARFLQTRGLVGCGDGSSSSSEETVKTAGAALIPRTSGQHTDFRPLNKQANIE